MGVLALTPTATTAVRRLPATPITTTAVRRLPAIPLTTTAWRLRPLNPVSPPDLRRLAPTPASTRATNLRPSTPAATTPLRLRPLTPASTTAPRLRPPQTGIDGGPEPASAQPATDGVRLNLRPANPYRARVGIHPPIPSARGTAGLVVVLALLLSTSLVTLTVARSQLGESRATAQQQAYAALNRRAESLWQRASLRLLATPPPAWQTTDQGLVSEFRAGDADGIAGHVRYRRATTDSPVVTLETGAHFVSGAPPAARTRQSLRLLSVLSPRGERAPPLVLNGCLAAAAPIDIRPRASDGDRAGAALWQFGTGRCAPPAALDPHGGEWLRLPLDFATASDPDADDHANVATDTDAGADPANAHAHAHADTDADANAEAGMDEAGDGGDGGAGVDGRTGAGGNAAADVGIEADAAADAAAEADLWGQLFSLSREAYAELAAGELALPPTRRRHWLASLRAGEIWRRSLGSAAQPVVLVFADGCPRFAAGVRIVGMVYIAGDCRAPPATLTLEVIGTLAVDGALHTGDARVRLSHIQQLDPRAERLRLPVLRTVAIPGSWRDF